MNRTFVCTIAATVSILAPGLSASAATLDDIMAQLKEMQQDNQAIRRDNEQMRKEIASLRREKSQKEITAAVPAAAPSRELPRSVTSAMAAVPPSASPYYKAVPISGPYDWSGFYVGLNAGYSVGRDHMVQQIGSESLAAGREAFDGLFGGIQLGHNWQYGAVVLGLEADMQYASIGGKTFSSTFSTGNDLTFDSANDRMDAFATIRGRLGYAFDRLMIYGTGGFAAGHVIQSVASGFETAVPPLAVAGFETDAGMVKGWVAGAGLEYAVHEGWSVKAEYLHLAFSNKAFFDGDSTSKIDFDLFRAGANYRF